MIAIYVRVSTEEQSTKGYSIRSQIEECAQKAATNNYVTYSDEGYSGEFLERPALEKLRKDVAEGTVDKVVCYDPDRLSRKLMNALIIDEEFRKRNVDVIYVNGDYENTPEGRLFYSLRGAISEFEKAKINQRMSGGRKKKAKEGKVVKNSHLYGYDFENGHYVINETEAEIVRYVFDSFLNQVGMNSIAKDLTKKGIPTKKGKSLWHRQVVRQMLMNETYTGVYYQNRWNTEGMLQNKYTDDPNKKVKMKERPKEEWIQVDVPDIIPREQWEQAQELLEHSRKRFAKTNKYLLSGLLRCGECGNTMVGTRAKWWNTHVLIYTDRKNYAGAKHPGCGNTVRVNELNEVVWQSVVNLLNEPEKLAEYQEQQDFSYERKEIERITKEIERTQKGRERLYNLITMSDDINMDEIKTQIVELQTRESELKESLEHYQGIVNQSSNTNVSVEQIKEMYNEFMEKELAFEEKQQLLRRLIKQVTIYDKENIEVSIF